jgi:hypothetical protein
MARKVGRIIARGDRRWRDQEAMFVTECSRRQRHIPSSKTKAQFRPSAPPLPWVTCSMLSLPASSVMVRTSVDLACEPGYSRTHRSSVWQQVVLAIPETPIGATRGISLLCSYFEELRK